MQSNRMKIFFPIFLLIIAALACSIPSTNGDTPADAGEGELGDSPADAGEDSPVQEESTPEPTATESEPTATVVHLITPDSPSGVHSFMTDRSSKQFANEKRTNADNFNSNQLERPFTSEVMDYQAHLDITRGELRLDAPWMYVTIFLEGSPPQDSQARYGVEVDLNVDGRGDWLITGLVPPDTNWTTDGVQAYKDNNHDVGGATPMKSDAPKPARNGYEELVFDQGQGPDPDAAWIRRDPAHNDRIQLAFKHSLIGSDNAFLWGPWSDELVQEAGYYDYHDHFTIQEAGSPILNNPDYPLKALASYDNTCRWAYGFNPVGNEIGVCKLPPTPTPPPTPLPPTLTPTTGLY